MSIQNQQEVKQFSPGPELDVKVAEARGDYYLYKVFDGEVWACLPETGDQEFICTKSPSTSISDADPLLDEMVADGHNIEINVNRNRSSVLVYTNNFDRLIMQIEAKTRAHVICLAFLEVKKNGDT